MKRSLMILAVVALSSCAASNTATPPASSPASVAAAAAEPMAMASQLAANPLISSLVGSLGLNTQQAVGGAGALLALAQNTLSPDNWTKLAAAIPGTTDMIKAANALGGGISSNARGLADLSGAFSKIGLSPDAVGTLVPALTDYVGKAAGPDVGSALAAVLK